uniref:C2H2-type domain-containing protein n=1 Tax=Leptobrachium leishanense TaxID=445787 RepID=A0A8C5MU58_9ANUR
MICSVGFSATKTWLCGSLASDMDQQSGSGTEIQSEDGILPSAISSRVEMKRERVRKRTPHPSKRGYRCSSHGCNRSFLTMHELITHVSVHYKPTESLKDKLFVCSVGGCGESLDSMQELMNHLKVHYKPNRYFKCENCMQHFRTHRSLFKHLHVCIENNANSAPLSVQPSLDSKFTAAVEPSKPRHQSVIQCIKKEAPISLTNKVLKSQSPYLTDDLRKSMNSLISQSSNTFPLLEPSVFGGQFPASASVAGSYLPFLHPSAYTIPQASVPQRIKSFLGNQGQPVSNAVWKKSQGHSTNSRILWEHTRDSYNCMQCTFSTDTRYQMTKHIEEQHKNPLNKLQCETDDYDVPSFDSKALSEENPVSSHRTNSF